MRLGFLVMLVVGFWTVWDPNLRAASAATEERFGQSKANDSYQRKRREVFQGPVRLEGEGLVVQFPTVNRWEPWLDRDQLGTVLKAKRRGRENYFLVARIDVGELEAPVEAILQGVFKMVGSQSAAMVRTEEEREATPDGWDLSFRGEEPFNNHILVNRFRVVRRGGQIYLINGWTTKLASLADQLQIRWMVSETLIEDAGPLLPRDQFAEDRRRGAALFANRVGIWFYDGARYTEAIDWLELAAEYDGHDLVIATNLLRALSLAGRNGDALEKAKALEERFPEAPAIWERLAYLHRALGFDGQAKHYFERLHTAGAGDLDSIFDHTAILIEEEAYEEALEVLRKVIERDPLMDYRRWEVQILRLAGRLEEGFEKLEAMRRDYGERFDLTREEVRLLMAGNRYGEGLILVNEVLVESPRNIEFLQIKGDILIELGELIQARETFQKLLEYEPKDAEGQASLRYVNSLLGRATFTSANEVKPVELPQFLGERLEAAEARILEAGETGWTLFADLVEWAPGERLRQTHRRRLVITEAAAVLRYSTLNFEYDPDFERVGVEHVRVTDREGRWSKEADLTRSYLTDLSKSGYGKDEKQLVVPVSGLEVGTILEYVVTRETLGTHQVMPLRRIRFSRSEPVGAYLAAYRIPREAIRWETRETARASEQEGWVYWLKEDVEPMPLLEGDLPPLDAFVPWVAVGSAVTDWGTLGRDYLKDLEAVLEPSATAAAWVERELGAGMGELEAIERISRFVRGGLVYHAMAFGVGATMPKTAEEIFELRYGDCKDHSLLGVQLLRAAGVDAYLALVDTRVPVIAELPSLLQFDHMVVAIRRAEGWDFHDFTDEVLSSRYTVPIGLQDSLALILAEEPELVQIGSLALEDSRVVVERTIEDDEDGSRLVRETAQFYGYEGSYLRYWFTDRLEREWRATLLGRLDGLVGLEIGEVKWEGMDNFEEVLKIEIEYTLPSGTPLPMAWERYYLHLRGRAERRHPFRIRFPVWFESIFPVRGSAVEERIFPVAGAGLEWGVEEAAGGKARLYLKREMGTWASDRYADFFLGYDGALRAAERLATGLAD
ncbi:MAG: DUF3857 domain-containing protein [Puniceicoccaceae bacterium]